MLNDNFRPGSFTLRQDNYSMGKQDRKGRGGIPGNKGNKPGQMRSKGNSKAAGQPKNKGNTKASGQPLNKGNVDAAGQTQNKGNVDAAGQPQNKGGAAPLGYSNS